MHSCVPAGLTFLLLITARVGFAAEDDRFISHGVAAQATRSHGATATVDGEGRRVVLVWLSGVGSLLVIDAETGETQQIEIPGPPGGNFAVLHSSRDLWYAHLGGTATGSTGTLYEFDPRTLSFTFSGETTDRYAMSMHEDGAGVVWGALYPNAQLISFNPDTRVLTDHGFLNEEPWPQYMRAGLARDEAGWMYTIIGYVRCQVVGYNPADGEIRRYIPEQDRAPGQSHVHGRLFLGTDGHVYATAPGWDWHRLYAGEATPLEEDEPPVGPVPMRTGASNALFREFPDGSSIHGWPGLSVENRTLVVMDADGTRRRVTFDYDAPGARIYSIVEGPDGALYGSTGHPMRLYRFDPRNGEFSHHGLGTQNGHLNAMAVQRGRLYAGWYPFGGLWEYDVTQSWTYGTEIWNEKEGNPRLLKLARPHIDRPHVLLAHPDGRHLVMGGTPDYGHTGGGLLIYDLETQESVVLTHEELLLHQSTQALMALPDGTLVGGTTAAPGTGGERRAEAAELYVFDWERREVVWRQPLLTGWPSLVDLLLGPDGLVYALASDARLFVFDPAAREIVHTTSLAEYGLPAPSQGPRLMALGPDGLIHILFLEAIVTLTPGTLEHASQADLPVKAFGGMVLHEGRLYFTSGPRVWSYALEKWRAGVHQGQ